MQGRHVRERTVQAKNRGGDVSERSEMRVVYGIAALLCLVVAVWARGGKGAATT